jgi:hypothetical protein
VPRLLTPDQRDNRLAACPALKEHLETDSDDLFSKVFLFPRMKRDLKGKRFADVEDVKKKQRKH